jgi:hypothetical protein
LVFRLKCQICQQWSHLTIFFISFKVKPVPFIGFTTYNKIFTPFWYQNFKNCKVVLPMKNMNMVEILLKYPNVNTYVPPNKLPWSEGLCLENCCCSGLCLAKSWSKFGLWWFSVTRFDYNGAEKSHDLLKNQGLSMVEFFFLSKKYPLQDLLSSLN